MSIDAVYFDIDFTLIYPKEDFMGEGYARYGSKAGLTLDASLYPKAIEVAIAAHASHKTAEHDETLLLNFVTDVIRHMGGGEDPRVKAVGQEIFSDWGRNENFELYEDAIPTLKALRARGKRIGIISNTHREIEAFLAHFELVEYIDGIVASRHHGKMKPHPEIYRAGLELFRFPADKCVMVGDNFTDDVQGAQQAGLWALLLDRSGTSDHPCTKIKTLEEVIPWVEDTKARQDLPGQPL